MERTTIGDYFWRCQRCRLMHFSEEEPLYCHQCDSVEFIMVLVRGGERRRLAPTASLVA